MSIGIAIAARGQTLTRFRLVFMKAMVLKTVNTLVNKTFPQPLLPNTENWINRLEDNSIGYVLIEIFEVFFHLLAILLSSFSVHKHRAAEQVSWKLKKFMKRLKLDLDEVTELKEELTDIIENLTPGYKKKKVKSCNLFNKHVQKYLSIVFTLIL